MARTDERLVDGAPMRPLRCQRCAAAVQVRKSSWHQTSIQWDAEAVSACHERRAAAPAGDGRFEACLALRDSVREAALNGGIEVIDG